MFDLIFFALALAAIAAWAAIERRRYRRKHVNTRRNWLKKGAQQ